MKGEITELNPLDGYYNFKTNSNANHNQDWFISGAIKIVRPLTEEEGRKISRSKGIKEDLPYKDGVKMSIEFIAECLRQNKPVFYHCAIGRDRTGTLSILVLGLLGVSEGDISKDYELTYFAPDGYSTNDGGEFKYHRAKSSAFVATVKHIWAYGKPTFKECVEAYLLDIGVSQQAMDDIYKAMLIEK